MSKEAPMRKAPIVIHTCALGILWSLVIGHWSFAADKPAPTHQYSHGDIKIALPSADEPRRKSVSVAAAEDYLRQATRAWAGSKDCITCHTTGLYMQVRPALTRQLGPPLPEMREFFVEKLNGFKTAKREDLLKATRPAQVIYLAAGLAEWDAHVTRKLSPETEQAIDEMFKLQLDSGTWGSLDCWPPYESDAYHLATVAAMTVGTAPDWLKKANAEQRANVERLGAYLRQTTPPHDYGRTLLLGASTRMPGLITSQQKKELIELLATHQRADGGWSLRTFSTPEMWGRGNRAAKLRAEPEFETSPSDGHMTGLALVVLREAGVSAKDARIQRGVKWLKENQRESGRWWTRSLNTDTYHFITYSGTAFPVLALGLCGELPAQPAARAALR